MKLSTNFSLEEMTRSDVAARMGRKVEASQAIIVALRTLCVEVLEPIRAHVGQRIHVSSGYRPAWLNEAIGGSQNSDHMFGTAADIEAEDMTPEELATEILMILPKLPIKQLILEYPPEGWVHVSRPFAGAIPKREVLTAQRRGGKTQYLSGLHVGAMA